MGLIVFSIAFALLLGLAIVWLSTKQYPKFQLEGIHWLLVLVCMAVTAVSLVTAVGASRGLSLMDQKKTTISSYTGILDSILDLDDDLSLTQVAGDIVKDVQHQQKQKLITSIVISVFALLAANTLLVIYLQKEGKKTNRRKSRKGSYTNHSSMKDNF